MLRFMRCMRGEFEKADDFASQVLARDSAFVRANVIRGLIRAESGKLEEARAIYESALVGRSEHDSILYQGLADFAMAEGRIHEALALLDNGLSIDAEAENNELRAQKLLMKLECQLTQDEVGDDLAKNCVGEILALSDSTSVVMSVAVLGLRFKIDIVDLASTTMKSKINTQGRAYVRAVDAIRETAEGNLGEATVKLNEALGVSDLWLIHFTAFLIYSAEGLILEAEDERSLCLRRVGEALSAGLDELPTYRNLALLRSGKT